ncbi:ABC transporter permease subunit [Paludicola sp. MB14-C6]|uniref:ABC transporter permease subunit n=1 Tax=Paludihabitans sp. MB14-C6 TaxID=3070656 RepID=UPI0027DD2E8C|nr:ABC transporter permease subunit [Paludicola sp. MB14-C6]WMJ22630.1 ABC transporter permease subunit [Paludicola sp. MB14-C6]
MNKHNFKINTLKLLIGVFLAVGLVIPIITMFFNMSKENIGQVLTSPQFGKSAINSLLVATTATILSVSFAGLLAWSIAKTNIKLKGAFCVLFTFPMLIPSISHGMGLVMLFGKNGVLTNSLHLTSNIYGFWGIVIGSIMYSFPVAFLMLYDVLAYEDCTAYEAADVLGISKSKQFLSITLPYLRKPLISIVFAVFSLIITDYGVPLMVGGKFTTLPVLMYQEVIGLLDFGKGSVIGAILMVPAIVAFLIDILNSDKSNMSYVVKAARITTNKVRDAFAYVINSISIVFVLLPIIAFILLTFVKKYPVDLSITIDNILQTFNMSGTQYLVNSVIIALLVCAVGVIITYITAYITARIHSKSSKLIHLITITSLAVPGIVLGLSYALFFKSSFIYGTIAILIFVNIIHFFASPYLLAYNSFNKLNENLESVGTTLGINRFYMIKDVFVPQMKTTLLEMISYFFVNSMITISAVSFLSTVKNMPISLLITQFEAQMLLECSAFVSLLILIINIVVKGVIYLLKRGIIAKEGI